MATKYKIDFAVWVIDWLLQRSDRWNEDTLEKTRAMQNDFLARGFGRRVSLHQIDNREFSGRHGMIPVRVYRATAKEDVPLIVFYHGGGFTIGNLESHDHVCRTIARDSDAVVISVDYRLAPEHQFPVAVEDAYDALCEAVKVAGDYGANPDMLFVAGDSAGGNLASVVCLIARENNAPRIDGQILMYPVVDGVSEYESRKVFVDAPILPKTAMDFFSQMYVREESDIQHPYCSPLLADNHHDLPPALIQVAEFDPLRDEGLAYADTLRTAGVDTQDICYPRTVHGFYSFGAFSSGTKKAYADIAQFVQAHA